jgi:hypothetical protein
LSRENSLRVAPPQSPRKPGARLAVVVAACAVVTLVGTSIVNRAQWSLRCEDGHLVAYRGLSLPLGSGRLDPDTYPAVEVPEPRCRDVTVSSRRDLEEQYLEATVQRIDSAIQSDDKSQLESAAQAVDRVVAAAGGASKLLADRKRALIVALLRADLKGAEAALGRARGRLRAAENAGVSEEVLTALRRELDDLTGKAAPEPAPTPPPAPLQTDEDLGGRSL